MRVQEATLTTTARDASNTDSLSVYLRFGGVGAFGGMCAFLLSRLLLVGPFAKAPWLLDLFGELFLGALAALFGVFLLTASDLKDRKTVVFAIACGFFWNPVLVSTQAYVTQHSDNVATSQAGGAVQKTDGLAQLPPQKQADAAAAAASDTASAIGKLQSLSPSAQQSIVQSSAQTVKNISQASASPASVAALDKIASASQQGGAPQVHQLALQQLRVLAATAENPQTRMLARESAARYQVRPQP